MKRYSLLFLLFFIPAIGYANPTGWDEDYFIHPLNIPVDLSGNFGELRGSHFHAGYDFRTRGQKGYDVKAAAEGYISRISVSPTGYGNALYITHPNGSKTVYAHLKEFSPEIKEIVRKEQFRKKSFSVRIHPNPSRLPVEQGEVIGKSGNSGSSSGPHLHFEIREASSQEPVNPDFFNFPFEDNYSPEIKAIQLHPLENSSTILVSRGNRTETARLNPVMLEVTRQGNSYELKHAEKVWVSGPVGVSVEAIDRMRNRGRPLGVKEVTFSKDEEVIFHDIKDRFAFWQTRYIQAYTDHSARIDKNRSFQRLYKLPNNNVPFYRTVRNRGIFEVEKGETSRFSLKVEDGHSNTSRLSFEMTGYQPSDHLFSPIQRLQVPFDKVMPYGQRNYFRNEHMHVSFPENSFYDTVYFNYTREHPYDEAFSHRHHIHDQKTPVHNFFTINIEPVNLPPELRDKAFVAHIDEDDDFSYVGSESSGARIKGRHRTLGMFEIRVDTVRPQIKASNFSAETKINQRDYLHFTIRDEVSGIASYEATVNGKWVLAEYDPKNDRLSIPLDQLIPNGSLNLKVEVADRLGNENTFETRLINRP